MIIILPVARWSSWLHRKNAVPIEDLLYGQSDEVPKDPCDRNASIPGLTSTRVAMSLDEVLMRRYRWQQRGSKPNGLGSWLEQHSKPSAIIESRDIVRRDGSIGSRP
jgi:hypothetical protein